MDPSIFIDPYLTLQDRLVLDVLISRDEQKRQGNPNVALPNNQQTIESRIDGDHESQVSASGEETKISSVSSHLHNRFNNQTVDSNKPIRINNHFQPREDAPKEEKYSQDSQSVIQRLKRMTDPAHEEFQPNCFVTLDIDDLRRTLPSWYRKWLLEPYIGWASGLVRSPTDVIMVTHLLLYLTTTLPSVVVLFLQFHLIHAVLHLVMQLYYIGTYTLMMHQHIHMRGILAPRLSFIDVAFPYVLDPLFGHTWNTYYYHHVKHHHVEGNGPHDLSSTIRYERDNPLHLTHYILRFFFVIWFDLFRYFMRKGQYKTAVRALASELCCIATIAFLATKVNFQATLWALIFPLLVMRLGLMVGNWGQHAFVDEEMPDSDFRSSITLIDVPSNRFCFNDGYHTSHHLNPTRHWREHPAAFLQALHKYEDEHALVFRNIDFLMITFRLLCKDYTYLAKCMIPIGGQCKLSLEERAALLKSKTRPLSEEDIQRKFKT